MWTHSILFNGISGSRSVGVSCVWRFGQLSSRIEVCGWTFLCLETHFKDKQSQGLQQFKFLRPSALRVQKIRTLARHISFYRKLKSPKPSSLLQDHKMRQRWSEIERAKRWGQEQPRPITTTASANAMLPLPLLQSETTRRRCGLALDQAARDSMWNHMRKIKSQNYEENQWKQVNYSLKFADFEVGKLSITLI